MYWFNVNSIWTKLDTTQGLYGQTAYVWGPDMLNNPMPPSQPEEPDISYRYTVRDQVDSMFYVPIEVWVKYAYNSRMLLDSLKAQTGGMDIFTQKLFYDTEGLGQIVAQESNHAGGTPLMQTYQYDNINQLVNWNVGSNFKIFTYDNIGNRLESVNNGLIEQYSYNDSNGPNRLTSFVNDKGDSTYYAYNSNGAMSQRAIRRYDGELWRQKDERFDYDPSGLLKKYMFIEQFSIDTCFDELEMINGVEWRYAYNPMSEREQKRLYGSVSGDNSGNVNPWVYYLLGGNNEQLVVYHGVQQSDVNIRCTDGSIIANPFERAVFMYPAEYNTYGAASSINVTMRTDSMGNWRKEFNIMDNLGSIRTVLRENYGLFEYRFQRDYKPYGGEIAATDKNRLTFIGKEKDNESYLGDFGVRKYDDGIGRFTSTEPIWEEFYSVSPYVYSANSPICFIDPTGLTKFYKGSAFTEVIDGSSAVFKLSGKGLGAHWKFKGFDSDDNSTYFINYTTVIEKMQELVLTETAFQPTYYKKGKKKGKLHKTFCNYATRSIMKGLASIPGNEWIRKKGLFNGMANSIYNRLKKLKPHDKISVIDNVDEIRNRISSTENQTNIFFESVYRKNKHGHIATFSVGKYFNFGTVVNVGETMGPRSTHIDEGNPIRFYSIQLQIKPTKIKIVK